MWITPSKRSTTRGKNGARHIARTPLNSYGGLCVVITPIGNIFDTQRFFFVILPRQIELKILKSKTMDAKKDIREDILMNAGKLLHYTNLMDKISSFMAIILLVAVFSCKKDKEITLSSIAVTTQPAKMSYFVDEAFDAAGMTVTATYSDKSTAEVKTADLKFEYDFETAGVKTVSVSYTEKGKTASAKVEGITVAALTCVISATTLAPFGSEEEGYAPPAAQTVTITNTGTGTVTLSQPAAENYDIGALSATTLAAKATATFAVQPKPDLPAGNYDETIAVNGSGGAAATVNARFEVSAATAAPEFTTHPQNITVSEGQSATFTAVATGNPAPAYKWQRSTDNGLNWYDQATLNDAAFTLNSVTVAMNGYQYRFVAINSVVPAGVPSNAATLTVNPATTTPPVISNVKAREITPTSEMIDYTLSDAATVYSAVYTSIAQRLTENDIKAHVGAVYSYNMPNVPAGTDWTFNPNPLTPNTQYTAYIVAENLNGFSNIAAVTFTTLP